MAIDKEAENLIIKARSRLLLTQPFFGHLTMNLKLKELVGSKADACKTAATDGKHLYYHPDFIKELNNEGFDRVIFLVAHEVMHVVLSHLGRRGVRHPILWNMACDYVINDALYLCGFVMPDGLLWDDKYRDMTADQVYNMLVSQAKKNKDGTMSIDLGRQHRSLDSHEGDEGYPGEGPMSESEVEELEEKWKDLTVKAAASTEAGNLPSAIQKMLDSFTKPKIKWQDVLRRCISEYTKSDYTWMKPNKRHFSSGIILPSMDKVEKIKLGIALDTSGSCYEDIPEFMSEIKGIVGMYDEYEINAAFFDTRVHNPKKITSENDFKFFASTVEGGGGTNFEAWWDWATESDWYCTGNAIIFFTDGYPYSSWITPEARKDNVYWVVKGGENEGPCGTTLFYDEE